jgi:hypothetical protein
MPMLEQAAWKHLRAGIPKLRFASLQVSLIPTACPAWWECTACPASSRRQ